MVEGEDMDKESVEESFVAKRVRLDSDDGHGHDDGESDRASTRRRAEAKSGEDRAPSEAEDEQSNDGNNDCYEDSEALYCFCQQPEDGR